MAKFFRRLPNYIFTEYSSFSWEKTITNLSSPVNELFSQVVINLKDEFEHLNLPNATEKMSTKNNMSNVETPIFNEI